MQIIDQSISNQINNVKYNHAKTIELDATPMFVNVIINEKNIKMEIDTGTYATVFSKKFYDENFSNIAMQPTYSAVKTYDGHSLKPIGKLTNLNVKLNEKLRILDSFVSPGSGQALIGRSWLKEFGYWPLLFPGQIYHLNKIDE